MARNLVKHHYLPNHEYHWRSDTLFTQTINDVLNANTFGYLEIIDDDVDVGTRYISYFYLSLLEPETKAAALDEWFAHNPARWPAGLFWQLTGNSPPHSTSVGFSVMDPSTPGVPYLLAPANYPALPPLDTYSRNDLADALLLPSNEQIHNQDIANQALIVMNGLLHRIQRDPVSKRVYAMGAGGTYRNFPEGGYPLIKYFYPVGKLSKFRTYPLTLLGPSDTGDTGQLQLDGNLATGLDIILDESVNLFQRTYMLVIGGVYYAMDGSVCYTAGKNVIRLRLSNSLYVARFLNTRHRTDFGSLGLSYGCNKRQDLANGYNGDCVDLVEMLSDEVIAKLLAHPTSFVAVFDNSSVRQIRHTDVLNYHPSRPHDGYWVDKFGVGLPDTPPMTSSFTTGIISDNRLVRDTLYKMGNFPKANAVNVTNESSHYLVPYQLYPVRRETGFVLDLAA